MKNIKYEKICFFFFQKLLLAFWFAWIGWGKLITIGGWWIVVLTGDVSGFIVYPYFTLYVVGPFAGLFISSLLCSKDENSKEFYIWLNITPLTYLKASFLCRGLFIDILLILSKLTYGF